MFAWTPACGEAHSGHGQPRKKRQTSHRQTCHHGASTTRPGKERQAGHLWPSGMGMAPGGASGTKFWAAAAAAQTQNTQIALSKKEQWHIGHTMGGDGLIAEPCACPWTPWRPDGKSSIRALRRAAVSSGGRAAGWSPAQRKAARPGGGCLQQTKKRTRGRNCARRGEQEQGARRFSWAPTSDLQGPERPRSGCRPRGHVPPSHPPCPCPPSSASPTPSGHFREANRGSRTS